MIGVPYELFWELDPNSLAPFVKAFEFKQRYDDKISWQQGAYIRMAIVSALNKNAKYPNKPLLNLEQHISDEEKQQLIKERFMRHAKAINSSRFGKDDF